MIPIRLNRASGIQRLERGELADAVSETRG